MNQPLDPLAFEAPAPGVDWLVLNDEVLQLGFAWLREVLAAPIAQAADAEPKAVEDAPARQRYHAAREALAGSGRACALDRLSGLFGLSPFDLDVLLLALAAQVDSQIAALCQQAQGGAGRGATRDLLEALFCPSPPSRLLARARLSPEAPLRRHRLALLDDADAASPITLDERIIGFIQGREGRDQRLAGLLRPIPPMPSPQTLLDKATGLTRRIISSGRTGAQISGPRTAGRRAVASAVAADFGLSAVEVDASAFPQDHGERRTLLAILAREATLIGACIVLDVSADNGAAEGAPATDRPQAARDAVAFGGSLILVLSEDPVAGLGDLALLRLSALTRTERLSAWRDAFATLPIDGDLIEDLVDHFPFGLAEMAEIADRLRDEDPIDGETLWNACRERGAGRLQGLARRVEPRRGWKDLVLPADVLADLHAVADQVGRRGVVYGHWGYDALLPYGRGVSALFAGPSGVGKTLAAEVIAGELGLDLYCVDLATVVSKYIGETEKNLKRIFDAAEEAGAVLLIDEADALFGKRTEIKDSHDRYANIEISYLLQRVEQHSGLVILATNMRSHIDFGFLRRLRYLIDFPFPDFDGRRALWRRAFPPQAPVADIDFDRLATLEIAGGNIVVIATNAAFLAAAEESAITMRHVRQAARAEFRKLDRLLDSDALDLPSARTTP